MSSNKQNPTTVSTGTLVTGTGTLSGVSIYNPHQQHIVQTLQMAVPTQYIIKKDEYEFYVEAKNFIKDVASSEDVPAGFREQAQRMIARMVMVKL